MDGAGSTSERYRSSHRVRKSTSSRPLKNYAKCLSHELRTPMHGIVGLLDIMQTTVNDASISSAGEHSQKTFIALKRDIEAIQESSRRAIDAADNLVRAVELSLNVPTLANPLSLEEYRQDLCDSMANRLKRRSSETDFEPFHSHHRKSRTLESAIASRELTSTHCNSWLLDEGVGNLQQDRREDNITSSPTAVGEDVSPQQMDNSLGIYLTNIRNCIRDVVNESVKREADLESAQTQDWKRGQRIELVAKTKEGTIRTKTITWDVELSVPDSIPVQSRDLAKILDCLVQNSLKFTEEGQIDIRVQRALIEKSLSIIVKDTGLGISREFQSELFKPFSQEDCSITRSREGLGLGLSVAKGLAQKLGGDLALLTTDTEGPNRGTSFSLRIPFSPRARSSPCTPWASKKTSPKQQPSLSFGELSSKPFRDYYSSIEPIEPTDFHLPELPVSPAETIPHFISPLTSPLPSLTQLNRFKLLQEPSYFPPVQPKTPRSVPYQTPLSLSSETFPTSKQIKREFAAEHPLNFMVVEDNVISRRLLVTMLTKLGYDAKTQIREASDGLEAVRLFQASTSSASRVRRCSSAPPSYPYQRRDGQTDPLDSSTPPSPGSPTQSRPVDVILMDLWMPKLDGYEATRQILQHFRDISLDASAVSPPLILAVTADATQAAVEKAAKVGIEGLVLKPFRVKDLEKVVKENVVRWEMQKGIAWQQELFPKHQE